MASGTLDADKIRKEKSKWGEGNKVYRRRPKKGTKNSASATEATTASPATAATTASPVTAATTDSPVTAATPVSPLPIADNGQTLTNEDANLQREQTLSRVAELSGDSPGQSLPHEPVGVQTVGPTGNGVVRPILTFVDDRVKIYLDASTSKIDIKELRDKLKEELDQVRRLTQKLEDKETEITHNSSLVGTANDDETYSQLQYPGNDTVDRRSLLRVDSEMGTDYMDRRALARAHSGVGSDMIDRRALMRVNSEVGPLANPEMSSLRHLSVSVGESVEKEKRTPKANQYYRNSDFLLGKDRLPPESNKRLKSNGGRKSEYSYYKVSHENYKKQVFRNCSILLQRLMKHKHGWVFNEPVNAKLLGLHDYHDIIKHPMDFGTIKSRLAQNFYKTPTAFADDVRLTFYNALTYNPKGQDVHVMAEQLSEIFEERWVTIENDYNRFLRNGWNYHAGMPTPTSRTVNQFRTLDRSQSMAFPFMARPKPSSYAPVSRKPAPKKPKARDPNKRDMTYEEKQKLSTNLQSLPSEKLDSIVQIIYKSNTSLPQNDDEIEVDIDSVDAETLWELDRFVTNYKKNLSKHRRKAELSQQGPRPLAGYTNLAMLETPTVSIPEAPKERRADEKSPVANPPNQEERRENNVSGSSSSSSSSSDSGSSSSDSDSSSAYGSDAGHSPRT